MVTVLKIVSHFDSPVPFEKIGFGHVLPPHSRLDVLWRHSTAEQRDVLRVRGLQSGVFEHPEAMPFRKQEKEIQESRNREMSWAAMSNLSQLSDRIDKLRS